MIGTCTCTYGCVDLQCTCMFSCLLVDLQLVPPSVKTYRTPCPGACIVHAVAQLLWYSPRRIHSHVPFLVCSLVWPTKLFLNSWCTVHVNLQQTCAITWTTLSWWGQTMHVHVHAGKTSVTAHAHVEPPVLEYTGLEFFRVLWCNPKPPHPWCACAR